MIVFVLKRTYVVYVRWRRIRVREQMPHVIKAIKRGLMWN